MIDLPGYLSTMKDGVGSLNVQKRSTTPPPFLVPDNPPIPWSPFSDTPSILYPSSCSLKTQSDFQKN